MVKYLNGWVGKVLVVVLAAFISIGFVTLSSFAEDVDYYVYGWVDSVSDGEMLLGYARSISGWAFDNDVDNGVHVWVTSDREGLNVVGETWTTDARSDVQSVFPDARLKSGFSWIVPQRFYDGIDHGFYFWGSRPGVALFSTNNATLIGDIVMAGVDNGLNGSFDGFGYSNDLIGWAADFDNIHQMNNQRLPILFYIDGEYVESTVTGEYRRDVLAIYGSVIGGDHGFTHTLDVPYRFRDGKSHLIQAYTIEVSEGRFVQLPGQYYAVIDESGLMHQIIWITDENGDSFSVIWIDGGDGNMVRVVWDESEGITIRESDSVNLFPGVSDTVEAVEEEVDGSAGLDGVNVDNDEEYENVQYGENEDVVFL